MPAPDPKSDNYYTVLGLEKGASGSEISKAYKKAALKWHPDKNPDNKETASDMFKNVTEAYEVLHDADKRKTYDQFGKQGLERGAGGAGVSFQQADDIFKAFFGGSDPFSMFFGDDADGFGNMAGGFGKGGGGPNIVFQGGGFPGMGKGGMMFGGMGPGKGKGGGRQEQPMPEYAIPKGTQVIVRGLKSAAEHNGRQGRITGWAPEKGRYEVECDDETTVSLKPVNVTQMASVEITGVQSQKELNGQRATIAGYNDDSGRYTLKLSAKINGRDAVSLQPGSVSLARWTRVVVTGLSNETFNGQMAQIIDVDCDANRYTVKCQNEKQIKIKFENVLC